MLSLWDAGESIPVPILAHLQVGKSIPVQKCNSLQGGLVHYNDAAAGTSNNRAVFSSVVPVSYVLWCGHTAIGHCMSANRLKLNTDTMELIWTGTWSNLERIPGGGVITDTQK